MKPLKTKVSITLDTDIIDVVKELAEQDDRTFSQYINLILKEHLKEKQDNKNGGYFGYPPFLICRHVVDSVHSSLIL